MKTVNGTEFRFDLGDNVADKVSGFVGIITSLDEFLYHPPMYSIKSSKLTRDGELIKSYLFDEFTLYLVRDGQGVEPKGDKITPKFRLGDLVKDKVTNKKFVIVGTSYCLNGCILYTVESPDVNKDGKLDEPMAFSELRLEIETKGYRTKEQPLAATGGPEKHPVSVRR